MTGEVVRGILAEAAAETGLDDFGDDWFLAPLEAWAADLDQPGLSDFGRRFLRRIALRDVCRRLRVIDTLKAHPEIDQVEVPPIVYVTGLERSGTTLLHNVLASHGAGRALLRWELMEPTPPPETGTHDSDPRIAMVQRSVDKTRGSMLEQMHWVNAGDPEECVWGFIDAVSMLGQAAGFCMPTWSSLLDTLDQTTAFSNYRRVVQLLLWKNPVPANGFLVLKAPQLGGHLPAFSAIFSEARFVVTDRDPFRCIVSLAAMVESIIEPFCTDNPVSNDGNRHRLAQQRVENKLDALAAFRQSAERSPIHVPYPELARDPVAAAAFVFAALGIPFTENDRKAARGFLNTQRAGRRATPPALLPDMGYDHNEVLAAEPIADYCHRFGVERELDRITGT